MGPKRNLPLVRTIKSEDFHSKPGSATTLAGESLLTEVARAGSDSGNDEERLGIERSGSSSRGIDPPSVIAPIFGAWSAASSPVAQPDAPASMIANKTKRAGLPPAFHASLNRGSHRYREATFLGMREKGATDWSFTTFTTILEG